MKYLPFIDGKYSTAPALVVLAKTPNHIDLFIFQIDEKYTQYITNKQHRRAENIHKYFYEKDLRVSTVVPINRYMANQFVSKHPSIFLLKQHEEKNALTNGKTGIVLLAKMTGWQWTIRTTFPFLMHYVAKCKKMWQYASWKRVRTG